MYFLQSLPVTAARPYDAPIEAVVDPSDPMMVPHAAVPPGASALVVPGANPTMVKSKGASLAMSPGTRKTTASIGSFMYLTGAVAPVQHWVEKALNGAKLGP